MVCIPRTTKTSTLAPRTTLETIPFRYSGATREELSSQSNVTDKKGKNNAPIAVHTAVHWV